MPPTKPPYPIEFKEEAVRLMRPSATSTAQISRQLGVSEQTLRNWRNHLEIDAGERDGLTTEEREELGLSLRERVGDPVSLFGFIEAWKATYYPISLMCRVLKISRSGYYYAWRERPPSRRARADEALTPENLISGIHRDSRGAYGAPRVHAELSALFGRSTLLAQAHCPPHARWRARGLPSA